MKHDSTTLSSGVHIFGHLNDFNKHLKLIPGGQKMDKRFLIDGRKVYEWSELLGKYVMVGHLGTLELGTRKELRAWLESKELKNKKSC